MSCNNCNGDHITTQCTELINSDDLPIYSKPTLPDTAWVVLLAEEPNYDFGGVLSAAYRLDLDRLVPNGTKQSLTYSLTATGTNGADISIPTGVVVPAYVEQFAPFQTKRAQATGAPTKAQFLIISLDQNVDDNYIIQSAGFYTFAATHSYDVGKIYYLSDSAPGGVTSVPPVGIVQPLFTVVDSTTIKIHVEV